MSDAPLILDAPARHQDDRPLGARIGAIVLHDTGGMTTAGTLTWFADPASQVSAHFLVGPIGEIYRCVFPARRAWHAGRSTLFGRPHLNDWSIGIELVDADDRTPYPRRQLEAAMALVAMLCQEHEILLNHVVGHCHVATPPGRKVDPGPDFDWFTFLLAVGRLIHP